MRKNHAFLFFPIKSCVQSSNVRLYDRTRFNGKIITHTHTFHLHTLFLTNIFFLSYSIQQTIADIYFSKDTNEWNQIIPRYIPPRHRTQKNYWLAITLFWVEYFEVKIKYIIPHSWLTALAIYRKVYLYFPDELDTYRNKFLSSLIYRDLDWRITQYSFLIYKLKIYKLIPLLNVGKFWKIMSSINLLS